MTTAEMEIVNCRRFLAAYARSQALIKEQQFDDDVARNYQQLALHFQKLGQEYDEIKALESDLASVLVAMTALKKEENGGAQLQRIPRVSELVKLREAQLRADMISNKSELIIEEDKQECTLGGKMKKEEKDCPTLELRSDLTADDFKSMLMVNTAPQDEKLSVKAMRKRLGLLERSDAQISASETVVREEQESIQSEMMTLAKQLKDRTQTINHSLTEDVKILDAVSQSAQSNTALLERENAKLKEQLASSIGLWTSLWLVAMLVVVFIVTYFYMKLFSRRW